MRQLIYVPTVHSPVELGSMAELAAKDYEEKVGEGSWKHYSQAVEDMWRGIRKRLDGLGVDWSRVRLYQDGLPVCDREAEIVNELARRGSINHQILRDLMGRGAALEGTEDPQLLRQELETLQQLKEKIVLGQEEWATALGPRTRELLNQRDEFIARRIDTTLKEGEVGVLFMGLLHRVDRHLPPDIKVEYLIHHLPFREG